MGFQKSDADLNLYFILVGDDPLILLLYVDDLFITGEDRFIQHCKRDVASEIDMTNMGLMHYFLGLDVWQEDGNIFVFQGRPDICFVVNTLSQFMMEPRRVHRVVVKYVLRYLRSTVDNGLDYVRCDGVKLIGCTDSDGGGSVSDRKNTFGCCFSLGSAIVSWFSRKQKSVALSNAEAKYMAASQAPSLWLRKMLHGLFIQMLRPTTIYCENQSCIKLS
eukprot:PITA_27482